DETHIRLVDAHPEGDGGHHDHGLTMLEAFLARLARTLVHAGVIGERLVSLAAEPGGDMPGLALRQAINDTALPTALLEERRELRAGIVLFFNGIADVRAIKAADERVLAVDLQMRQDLRPRRLVGSSGKGHARNARKLPH